MARMTDAETTGWLPPFAYPFGQGPRFGEPPFECDPAEAQDFCAFAVVVPSELPQGTVMTQATVRPEGPEQWSSVRLTVAGGGRRLRLKQFHFDWWRPTSAATELRRVRSVTRAGPHVVFWGRDRRGRAAAAATLGRTQVEVRIEQGTFVELELVRLLAGLRLVQPERLPLLAAAPFPTVSYHVRVGHGPCGLDELAAARWLTDLAHLAARSPVPVLLPESLPPGWAFDGGALWPSPPPAQVQWLLSADSPFGPATVVYARARPINDTQALKLPPTLPVEEGWRLRAEAVRGRRGWVGRQGGPLLGGWMVAWTEPRLGASYQLFVRAGVIQDARALSVFLAGLRSLEF